VEQRLGGHDAAMDEALHTAAPKVQIPLDLKSALAQADLWIVHNDWPQWRDLAAAVFAGIRRKVVVDGRRTLRGEVMQGIQLSVRADESNCPEGGAPPVSTQLHPHGAKLSRNANARVFASIPASGKSLNRKDSLGIMDAKQNKNL